MENKNTLSSIEERDELYALKQPSCVPAVGVDNFPSVDCIKNCVANVNGADHAKCNAVTNVVALQKANTVA